MESVLNLQMGAGEETYPCGQLSDGLEEGSVGIPLTKSTWYPSKVLFHLLVTRDFSYLLNHVNPSNSAWETFHCVKCQHVCLTLQCLYRAELSCLRQWFHLSPRSKCQQQNDFAAVFQNNVGC